MRTIIGFGCEPMRRRRHKPDTGSRTFSPADAARSAGFRHAAHNCLRRSDDVRHVTWLGNQGSSIPRSRQILCVGSCSAGKEHPVGVFGFCSRAEPQATRFARTCRGPSGYWYSRHANGRPEPQRGDFVVPGVSRVARHHPGSANAPRMAGEPTTTISSGAAGARYKPHPASR